MQRVKSPLNIAIVILLNRRIVFLIALAILSLPSRLIMAINHTLTDEELKTILTTAIAAKSKAYCPYSNFRVGAAILVEKHPKLEKLIWPGSNVEVMQTPIYGESY